MIRLPEGFIPTRYDGYFWNVKEQNLYSIKISGVLRKLKPSKGYTGYSSGQYVHVPPHYRVSVEGRKRYLYIMELKKLKDDGQTHYITVAQDET